MRVIQVAAKTGVSPSAVRYYTRIGLLMPARQSGNRYRWFTDADVKHLSFIRSAQKLGFTLAEIRKIYEKSRTGQTLCPLVREILQRRIVENSKRLEEVVALQRNMERALRRLKRMPVSAPDGDIICHLIETYGSTRGLTC